MLLRMRVLPPFRRLPELPGRRLGALLLPLLPVLLLALGPGCASAKYNRAWKRYEAPAESHPFEGRWEGGWRSEWNGHDGGLRCIVTREEAGGFLAWFDSTYGIFSFRHKALFTLTEDTAERIRFEGAEDLGSMFGGVYTYDGAITGDDFQAIYSAENGDHGVFTMTRVVPAVAEP